LIYPATDVHIRKYETQKRVMVEETPGLYAKVVRPYIESMPSSRIQW
jgi:m7GpppX diphosphatase